LSIEDGLRHDKMVHNDVAKAAESQGAAQAVATCAII
jgi:hypothetical protein